MKTFDIFLDNNNITCICQEADYMIFDKDTKTVKFMKKSDKWDGVASGIIGIVNMDKVVAILANEDEEDCE